MGELNQMTKNLEEIKNDKDTLEQEIVEFKEKVEKLTTEVGQLTKDKEAKMHRIKLLLGNQKKAQESHDENVKMVEDALKEKEQLESDYEKYKKDAENEIEKLTAKNAANSESEDLPWETDPELRDMTAVELRAILADDLTGILLFFFREIKFLFTIMFFRERSVT